jgi:hypothetical protein
MRALEFEKSLTKRRVKSYGIVEMLEAFVFFIFFFFSAVPISSWISKALYLSAAMQFCFFRKDDDILSRSYAVRLDGPAVLYLLNGSNATFLWRNKMVLYFR